MSLNNVASGNNIPEEFNVIIEISMNSMPVKYEVDKETGAIFVDRFILTSMNYPCNYGYIPGTLSKDGDPSDVLVITPFPVQAGSVIRCRAIGMLEMEDESGVDAKILALPISKIYATYSNISSYIDLPENEIRRIQHFFEHYKDLEKGKWVKVKGWRDNKSAHEEIMSSIRFYESQRNL
ncbi:inorganic pyrophosphatase [Candidatus Kinetoplastibacterium blastocrithidii TCC012E]|uniref:Inorganic pyrophosphatase n=1 Tax=Candidatus Kinetoplastidibacterium blastocrithidiae TCC012E TaxID=1208922 RepID=M1MCZ7_9PROT|nr:inorganic diphosphatase [Candidatus Kinetoplastibacterium blastocrithidii]AFZ83531.1 inorganic pyrophosphatase [Candidatus Kinetoplastibacterium blastocrithidii (ex Strigomonas culicis)]AGF49650.1 inorganic pyrophosphatase [Candidatus Kinetoplastibacterium blastocrithidii TCC012E]